MPYTEPSYETAIIQLFEKMGYSHVYGPDVENRNFNSPLYMEKLEEALYKLNPGLPEEAISEIRQGKIFDDVQALEGYLESLSS